MPDHVLERRFWLPRPRAEVFEFFARVTNLTLVQPPSAGLRWLTPPPETLSVGAVIDFSVRLLGLRVRWRSLIREYDPPHRFVDVQLWGPFARWEHQHRFLEGSETGEAHGAVGTWVEDRVTYCLPLGPVGRLAHRLGAERRIIALFDDREQRLRRLLGGDGAPTLVADAEGQQQR